MISSSSDPCVYCGDSPVNHTLQYIETSIDCLQSSFSTPREKPRSRLMQFQSSTIVRAIETFLLFVLQTFNVVTFSTDKEQVATKRSKSIWNEADRRGIQMEEVLVFGSRKDYMRAKLPRRKGSKKLRWHYFQSIPIPPWNDQYGVPWVDDKSSFKKILLKNNLPVPLGKAVMTVTGAQKVLATFGTHVIAKPREGSRGRHTTIAISTPGELAEAFARAKQLCPFVLVEEYIPGRVYRATCVGNKVIGVMELTRPEVVADGRMTVEELRIHHNTHNKDFSSLTDVEDNRLFRNAIAHQGYTPESIPGKGTKVLLAEFSERSNGGYFYDCTDDIPASTIATIEKAAAVCGVDLVGFDIISMDLTDASERFVFIEGNTLPYIEIHDIPYSGKVRNVSSAIFDRWMK